jgi:hypothetical protein
MTYNAQQIVFLLVTSTPLFSNKSRPAFHLPQNTYISTKTKPNQTKHAHITAPHQHAIYIFNNSAN